MYRETTSMTEVKIKGAIGITPIYRETTAYSTFNLLSISRITPIYRETTKPVKLKSFAVENNSYIQGSNSKF